MRAGDDQYVRCRISERARCRRRCAWMRRMVIRRRGGNAGRSDDLLLQLLSGVQGTNGLAAENYGACLHDRDEPARHGATVCVARRTS